MNEQGMQHLEMIQNVITRMAQNSFTLKGWAATLVAAAFALASKEANQWYLLVALVPTLAFWGLDAYYLRLERLFRRLYDDTRRKADDDLAKDPFTMNIGPYMKAERSWCRILWTVSEIGYYGPVLAVIMVAAVVAFRAHGQ